MTIVRRSRRPAGPTPQQRIAQLRQELLTEQQRHVAEVAELQRQLAIERQARTLRDGQVMVLQRTSEGLRGQLLNKRRELAQFMRAHGAGDQVRDDPDMP